MKAFMEASMKASVEVNNKLEIINNNCLTRKLGKKVRWKLPRNKITATKASVKASGMWLTYSFHHV